MLARTLYANWLAASPPKASSGVMALDALIISRVGELVEVTSPYWYEIPVQCAVFQQAVARVCEYLQVLRGEHIAVCVIVDAVHPPPDREFRTEL